MTCRLVIAAIAPSIFAVTVAAQAPSITFEVASIKRNLGSDPGGSVRIDPGNRLTVTNIPLAGLVRHAYGTQRWEMVPGENLPSWMETERWDIRAKAGPDATSEKISEMFQNLLGDRFKLVAKREARHIPVYVLVRLRSDGRLGPQLRPSTVDCNASQAACGMRDLRGNISMTGAPWVNFPRSLSLPAGRFIVDQTGISGPVDLHLTWTPDQPQGPGAAALNDPPPLFTAVEDQLGLRLEARAAAVQVLVIYSAQRPTED